ncbi:MAG: hypothetical protein L0K86_22615, partial [Actinomycetia bacterium]|nr:hypothetical protein [Actinomycetes bacterium]
PLWDRVATTDYRFRIGPSFFDRSSAIDAIAQRVETEALTSLQRAARYRGEVLPPLRRLLDDAEFYRPPTASVADTHRHCLAALRATVGSFEDIVRGYETNDAALVERGAAAFQTIATEWTVWAAAKAQL